MRTRRLRKRLQQRRQTELHALVSHLLEHPQADIADRVRRLETYTEVLTFLQPRISREAMLSVVVAIISLALAGFLWSVRVAETRLTLKVQSTSVAMQFAKPWSWRGNLPLEPRLVTLEAMTVLESPELFTRLVSPRGDAWLQVVGGTIALVALHLEEDGRVELDRRTAETLEIYTRNAPLVGQLTIRGAARLKAGIATGDASLHTPVDVEIPETLSFRAEGQGAVPAKLRLSPQEPLEIHNAQVQELRFGREIPTEAGEITFVPTILSGSLLLRDVAESRTLREGEPLTLAGIRGRLVELHAGETISLQFEGTARQVWIGPSDAHHDLAPSLLRYYYHREPLTFFWSAVVFFWGILWSIRTTVFH